MPKKILLFIKDEQSRESLKNILANQHALILTDNAKQCLDVLKHASDIGLLLVDSAQENSQKPNKWLSDIKSTSPSLPIIHVMGYPSQKDSAPTKSESRISKPFQEQKILAMVGKFVDEKS